MNLDKVVSLAVVGAVLAVQAACSCPEAYDEIVPLLPPADGASLDEDFYTLACRRECEGSLACEPEPVLLESGEELPALRCTFLPQCGLGRRPRLARSLPAGPQDTAGWLLRAARLEADSVYAFRQLRQDLRRLGAPRSLLQACGRSAREERRHARSMGALARRYGGRPSGGSPTLPRAAPTLLELARHNAVEGCARESFGAALALWQARAATDPQVRIVMARIAHEEGRHAALSWKIDAWARPRLSAAQRREVDQARAQAVREILGAPWAAGRAELGLPDPAQGAALARALFARLGELVTLQGSSVHPSSLHSSEVSGPRSL
jgi:hypothetical protein